MSKGMIAVHIAVLLFGTAGLFGKFLDLSPVLIVFGRVAFASLFLAIYMLLKSRNRNISYDFRNIKGSLFTVCLLGVILSIHWITFFHSIQVSTVAIGLLSFSTFPIIVVFLEPLVLKTSFRIKYLLFALISLIGVRLLIPSFSWQNHYFQGVVWGVISGVLFAFLTVINKVLAAKHSAVFIAFWQNMIAFALLLIPVLIYYRTFVTLAEWMILLLLGVVFTALSHTLFIYGLKSVRARVAGIIACMEPVYGIIFAFILLSEIPSLRMIAGGLMILGTTLYISIRR